jgi:hypothetical protein
MPGGRPTLYDAKINEQVYKLCLLGATDDDIADFLEVSIATVNNWKIDYPEFFESIKDGKELADANVADRLYKRATGYEHPEDQIFQYKGMPVIVQTIKHYAPDTAAAAFWLKNRHPDKWRDRQDIDHHIDITANLAPARSIEQLARLDAKKAALLTGQPEAELYERYFQYYTNLYTPQAAIDADFTVVQDL